MSFTEPSLSSLSGPYSLFFSPPPNIYLTILKMLLQDCSLKSAVIPNPPVTQRNKTETLTCPGDKEKLSWSRELNSGYQESLQEDMSHVFQIPFLKSTLTTAWNLARASANTCKTNDPNCKESKYFQSYLSSERYHCLAGNAHYTWDTSLEITLAIHFWIPVWI